MFDSLKLSEIPDRQCGILRRPSSTRPLICVVEDDGLRAVVKDFSTGRFLFRNTVGRFLVWREAKAYRRLRRIKGIPALYRVIDGLALVMEEIPSTDLESLETASRLPGNFFDGLHELVDRFHERGLAHCDLKRAPNTLVGHDGRPYIIDWGASISESEFKFFPLNRIYERFLLDDYMAIIKLKLRHEPGAVTGEERERYSRRSVGEEVVRRIRDRLRELLQKLA